MNRHMLGIILVLGTFLVTQAPAVTGKNLEDHTMVLSWESPFPASWYKKSIDSSMRLWGDLEALLKIKETMNPEESLLLLNAALGQLVYVHHCIEQLNIDKKMALYADDGAYLGTIIHRLSNAADQISQKFSYECTKCFSPLIDKIRRTLDQIPQVR